MKKQLDHLSRAASNDKIKKTMEAEGMIDRLISRESEEKLKVQAQKFGEVIKEKEEVIKEKEEVIKEKDNAIQALKALLANHRE